MLNFDIVFNSSLQNRLMRYKLSLLINTCSCYLSSDLRLFCHDMFTLLLVFQFIIFFNDYMNYSYCIFADFLILQLMSYRVNSFWLGYTVNNFFLLICKEHNLSLIHYGFHQLSLFSILTSGIVLDNYFFFLNL